MDSKDIVAGIVAVGATVLGGLQIALGHDGTIISLVAGIYGVILGYVFGAKSSGQA
jgi:hypothetical protein